MAGGAFAQEQAPGQGQFFPPPVRIPAVPLVPVPKPLRNPPPQSNFVIRDVPRLNPAAAGGRCAVPAMADPIGVRPPVPACNADAPKAPTNLEERLKQLKEAQQIELERIKQLRDIRQAEPAK
jgi:hypothetical protein